MVFKFGEAEFHWQWRWFCRPNQMIGMSVEDYYSRFCDWKEEMISLSFPAEEEDYIDGFIENLSWDIRLRSSNYRSSRSGFINAFYNAKFEESMMFIDENLKKIKANRVFEDIPSRVPVDEFQVAVGKDSACNVFDKMTESTPTESLEILTMDYPQVLGNDNSNSAMANGNPIKEVLESEDENYYDVNAQGNDDVAMRLEVDSGKVVMANGVAYKMFNNSTDKSTEPNFTGLNLFSGKSYPISTMEEVEFPSLKAGVQLMEKDDELFPSKLEVVKVAYKAFDEMPKTFSVEPNAEIHGDKVSITLIDCVPQVFDPGSDTTENVCTNGSSLEEIEGLAPRKGRSLMYPALGKCKNAPVLIDNDILFYFNMGRSSWFQKGSDSAGFQVKNHESIFDSREIPYDELEKKVDIPELKLQPLHWDKVVASSESKMVSYRFMSNSFKLNEVLEILFVTRAPIRVTHGTCFMLSNEKGKVIDPKKYQYIAILLNDLNVTVDELLEALFAMRKEKTLLFLPSLRHGVEYLKMSLETLDVVGEEITLTKNLMFMFDPGGYDEYGQCLIEEVVPLRCELSKSEFIYERIGTIKGAFLFLIRMVNSRIIDEDLTSYFQVTMVLYISIWADDSVHWYLRDEPDMHYSRLAWSFNNSWAHAMMQEIKNVLFADARKIVVMALFSISCAPDSLWQCRSKKGKCMDIINGMTPKNNVVIRYMADELKEELRDATLIIQSEMEIQDCLFIVDVENFVWDPGRNVVLLYILEDKDDFERVGKDIVLMDTTLEVTGMIMILGRLYGQSFWNLDWDALYASRCIPNGLGDTVGALDDIGLIPKTLVIFYCRAETLHMGPGFFRISLAALGRISMGIFISPP